MVVAIGFFSDQNIGIGSFCGGELQTYHSLTVRWQISPQGSLLLALFCLILLTFLLPVEGFKYCSCKGATVPVVQVSCYADLL